MRLMSRAQIRSAPRRLAKYIVKLANTIIVSIFSLVPFRLALVLVRSLLEAQGIGAGARVVQSGEIRAARLLLEAECNGPVVILDIGANRGEYSELLLKMLPALQIHAFEPASETFELLKSRLGHKPNVMLHNFALGRMDGKAPLFKENPVARIASLTKLDVVRTNLTEEVAIHRLDSVFSTLRVEEVHLAKIDVEGHEMDVLAGAEETIKSGKIRNIQFELGEFSIDTGTTLKSFFNFFEDYGYELFLIRPGSLYQLERYKPIFEQYTTTNFIARRR